MKIGTPVPQRSTERVDIHISPDDYYGGMHCGETFDVKLNGKWVPTHIEMRNNWYIVDADVDDLVGLIVQI